MSTTDLHRYSRDPGILERLENAVLHVAAGIREWHRRRLNRAAFRNLLTQEDWVFHDIGISRADAQWAAGLPLERNAAEELERLRARHILGR